eukprot:Hpha_TRINITY_DN16354_c0_g1::TRINITY_DN16354_c0_g1_i1::g.60314::m.60314
MPSSSENGEEVAGPLAGEGDDAVPGTGAEGQLLHQLHLEQKRSDALRQQLMEAQHALRRLRAQPQSASAVVMEDQGRLLKDAQGVVLELREDLLQLQRENAELRERAEIAEVQAADLQEIRKAAIETEERHRRELREQRYKLLRAQQERQQLAGELEVAKTSLDSRPSESVSPEPGRVRALETALAESRKEAATLREQRLTALAREIDGSSGSVPRQAGAPRIDGEKRRLMDALSESEEQLGAAVREMGVLRRRCEDLQARCDAQREALQRSGNEYEALLRSRAQELGTIGALSSSLNDTRELYEQSQDELRRAQAELRLSRPRSGDITPPPRQASPRTDSTGGDEGEVLRLRKELEAVKHTASNAIATLSASLKKALLQQQHSAKTEDGLKDRAKRAVDDGEKLRGENAALRQKLAAAGEEMEILRKKLKEHNTRAIAAKQRLKEEILGTRELIRSQQHEMLGCDVAALATSPTTAVFSRELGPDSATREGFLLSPTPQNTSPPARRPASPVVPPSMGSPERVPGLSRDQRSAERNHGGSTSPAIRRQRVSPGGPGRI